LKDCLGIVQASPQAPPGAAGGAGLMKIWPRVSSLAARLLPSIAENRMPPWHSTININVDDRIWQLKADMGDLRACGLVTYRCDELRSYDYLQAWIKHLVLCASPPDGVHLKTKHFAFDKDLTFDVITRNEAEQYLAGLVNLYHEGLEEPVPFFRKAAWECLDKSGNDAVRKWYGGYGMKGEAESLDIWHSLAWRGVADPLDGKFTEIARCVYEPLRKHMTTEDVVIPGEENK
jgi:exodeoxyribonuclease V gamma subunit